MAADREQREPLARRATPAQWQGWPTSLVLVGQRRLALLGLTLALGLAGGVVLLYLFASLAGEVMAQETMHLDVAVLLWLHGFSSPALDAAALVFSAMGSEGLAVLLVVLVVWCAVRGRWAIVGGLIITTIGAQLLNDVLKDWFHRTRPAPVGLLIPAQAFSFPSGHAMVSAAFYFFLAYLGWRALSGWARWVWGGGLLLLVLLIGLSRLYLGVHYLTDVVAGYLAGLLWADAVIIGGHLLLRRQPSAPRASGN
jgi:membrane-associated phospholipid phosphatase